MIIINKENYQSLFLNLGIGYSYNKVIFDEDGLPCDYQFIEVNQLFEDITAFKSNEIVGKKLSELPSIADDLELYKYKDRYNKVVNIANNGGKIEYDQYINKFNVWLKVTTYRPSKGYLLTSIKDITKDKKLKGELYNKSRELENFFELNLDLLCIADLDGNFIKVNKSWVDILGHSKEELEKRNFLDFVHPDDIDATLNSINKLGKGKKVINFVNRYMIQDGTYRNIEWRSQPYNNLIYGAARDITHQMKTMEKISYLSLHDQLTGAYNRRAFDEMVKQIDNPASLPLSLIVADLDNLKLVNDVFGHFAGDQLIKKAVDTLTSISRKDDLVFRIGGDEFAIVLPNTSDRDVEKVANRIIFESKNIKVENLQISLSLGWNTKNTMAIDFEKAFNDAESNMYKYKTTNSTVNKQNMFKQLLKGLYEKYPKEENNSKAVSKLCLELGKELSYLDKDYLELLEKAGFLYNIGKIVKDEKSDRKIEELTNANFAKIYPCPQTGYRILNIVAERKELADYILYQSEYWDGTGHPAKLKGKEIPVISRIIGLVAFYQELITTTFDDNKTFNKQEAIELIKEYSGKRYDPDIVDVFLKVIDKNE